MGLLFENISMAISSIKSNKMRSFLTMLGIIIGISSVITISSLGGSINATMNKFFSSFGKNRIILYVNGDGSDNFSYSDFMSLEDIEVLKQKFPDAIGYIAPYLIKNADDIEHNNQKANIALLGIDYNYFDFVQGYKLLHGRFLEENDMKTRKKNVMVSDTFAKKLFFKTNAVGETLNIKAQEGFEEQVTIVGVFHKETTIFESMNRGDRTEVFAPYSIFPYIDESGALDIFLHPNISLKETSQKVTSFFNRYKQKDGEFYKTESLDEQVGIINNILGMVSLGVGAIAGISLVVGGIGIMNIMLVSVTERTKEIGIRKSLGARKKDILSQFLIESIILSGLGGIIGTVLGVLLSLGLTKIIKTAPVIPVASIIVAVGFSAIVGVFFGLYPANKAAKLNPIDALRYE